MSFTCFSRRLDLKAARLTFNTFNSSFQRLSVNKGIRYSYFDARKIVAPLKHAKETLEFANDSHLQSFVVRRQRKARCSKKIEARAEIVNATSTKLVS